jgi:hypothetical protein
MTGGFIFIPIWLLTQQEPDFTEINGSAPEACPVAVGQWITANLQASARPVALMSLKLCQTMNGRKTAGELPSPTQVALIPGALLAGRSKSR